MIRHLLLSLLFMLLSIGGGGRLSAEARPSLRVLVLENSPPMSFRDETGLLTGFSVDIARAICDEMRAHCVIDVTTQDLLVERLVQGKADFTATGLLETPERQGRLLFSKPYYRSISLWLARPGIKPGQSGIRVAIVAGSAQEEYARKQGWALHRVATNGELGLPIISGEAQAALVPMVSALSLQKNEAFRSLDLSTTIMTPSALGGDAAFAISPLRPELKAEINAALERIKRNGTYDRINSRYLPFRVS